LHTHLLVHFIFSVTLLVVLWRPSELPHNISSDIRMRASGVETGPF
jgi:hypothetical protein